MSRRLAREIARRLKARGEIEPPADLLARIQAAIPEAVEVGLDAAAGPREPLRRPAARRAWLLAASLVAMAGAGLLAYRLFEGDRALVPVPSRAPASLAAPATRQEPAAAPPPPAAPRIAADRPPAPQAVLPLSSLKKPSAPAAAPPPVSIPEREVAGGVPGGVAGGVAGGAPAGEPAGAQPEPAPAAPGSADFPATAEASEPKLAEEAAPPAPSPPQAKAALAKPERSRPAPWSVRLATLEAELAAIEGGTRPKSDLPELLRRARALAAERPGDPRAAALLSRIARLSP